MDDGTATSFRQVGKETRGQLRRGFTAGQNSGARTFSSIPSKFETTLFTGAKPKEGFGSRAHRFTETENDLPGPGSYEGASVPLRDDKVYSKKGLGVGFVSKTQRQGLVRPGVVPGPGNYEETRTLARDLAARGASSAFKQPSQRPVTVAAAGSQPGPGQYSTATPGSFDARQAEWRRERSKRESDAARSASLQMRMQSGLMPTPSKRSVPPAASTLPTPGPTEYQPTLASDMPNAERTLPSGWARASGRAGGKKPLRTSLEQQLGIVPRDDGATPGPGQYVGADAVPLNPASAARNTAAFSESKIDRFGRALPGSTRANVAPVSTPGPGQYYKEKRREGAPISSAVFMSGTARVQEGGAGVGYAPGPAFYKPEAAAVRKSHHLNTQQRWLPAA